MKYSRYNLRTREGSKLIVYNTLTGALVVIDQSVSQVERSMNSTNPAFLIPQDLIEPFRDHGIMIDDDYDERAIVHLRNMSGRTQNELILSIMLTLQCNFRCRYCFQERSRQVLTDEVERRIMRWLEKRVPKLDRLSVDWYGGEPLIERSKLLRLNSWIGNLCHEWETDYIVTLTTNGFLLDAEMIAYLKNYQVGHLQITLDGPADCHDFSRPLANGEETFAKVFGNICRAREAGIPISIRVNAWRPNIERIPEIYAILEAAGLKNEVHVIAKPVLTSEANPCADLCLDTPEASERIMEMYLEAADSGWIVLPYADTLQGHEFCIVDSLGQFIVGPDGNIYKCGERFSKEERVGQLSGEGELILDETEWSGWVAKNPLSFPECSGCKYLPICMGGCSMKRKWKPEESPCVEIKYAEGNFLRVLVRNEQNKKGG